MLFGSSQFTIAWMLLSRSSMLCDDSPSVVHYVSTSTRAHHFQRLSVLVVRFAVQTLRIDPARPGRFRVARVEEDHVGGEDVALVNHHNVAHSNVALRDFFELLRLLVEHAELATVGLFVGAMPIPVVTN